MISRSLIVFLLLIASPAYAYLTKPPPPPSSNAEVTLEAKSSHGTILRSGDEDFYILVTTKTAKNESAKKLPLNITIVIDRSGSMADNGKLNFAKQAAKEFINKLGNEDRVSLVEYDEQITVLAEPTLVGTDRGVLLKKIDLLEPRGSTDLAGGMVEGGKQAERFFDENRINRVLLLSDGLANTGVVQIPAVANLAEGLSRKGIQVTTFGLGSDFDEEMMTRIADSAGGNYYFIESGPQIAGIFEKERHALSTVVGKKAKLVVEPEREIEFMDAFGYQTKKSGNKIVVDIPDLFSGQNRKILLRFKPKIKEARELVAATVTLEYTSTAQNLVRKELRDRPTPM
ncbi:MAG: VWA domain-containing protein [Deltaproteobacteria bacterium]|nr:VWA domain-containing protein [Deltaproteobacteria bacterium]